MSHPNFTPNFSNLRRGPRGASHKKFHAAPSKKQARFLEGPFLLELKGKATFLEAPFASKKVLRGTFCGSPPSAPLLKLADKTENFSLPHFCRVAAVTKKEREVLDSDRRAWRVVHSGLEPDDSALQLFLEAAADQEAQAANSGSLKACTLWFREALCKSFEREIEREREIDRERGGVEIEREREIEGGSR